MKTEKNPGNDLEGFVPKAARREQKKRPRMAVHGSSLKKPQKFAGLSIIKKKRK